MVLAEGCASVFFFALRPCKNALALRLVAAKRRWKRSALCVLRAVSYSGLPKTSRAIVAEMYQETRVPVGRGNAACKE